MDKWYLNRGPLHKSLSLGIFVFGNASRDLSRAIIATMSRRRSNSAWARNRISSLDQVWIGALWEVLASKPARCSALWAREMWTFKRWTPLNNQPPLGHEFGFFSKKGHIIQEQAWICLICWSLSFLVPFVFWLLQGDPVICNPNRHRKSNLK